MKAMPSGPNDFPKAPTLCLKELSLQVNLGGNTPYSDSNNAFIKRSLRASLALPSLVDETRRGSYEK